MSPVQRLPREEKRAHAMPVLGLSRRGSWVSGLLLFSVLVLSGCSTRQDHQSIISNQSPIKPSEFFQSHADRMATLGMRNNLNSLYRLMDKLYLRNPREWRKTGLADAQPAKRAVHRAIEQDQPLPQLGGRTDIAALSYAVEFGKIVARLDLLTDVLDERYRRMGVSYAQGLLFMNFLPVQ